MIKVSIIIPAIRINDYIRESMRHIIAMDYEDFEVVLLPDEQTGESFPKSRIVPTGRMGPAQKRDLALGYAEGEFLAFLDDDAYPRKDWLKRALVHFNDPSVAAVGGPAVTPPGDSFSQRVSGAVFLTSIGGGAPERYWPVGNVREIDDCPSVNLIVRRDVFEGVGGFNTAYWPGEDTKLCLDIIRAGRRIIYDPEVFVWHHRREGLIRHLKQIGRYGLHRGFFAKEFPETSRRLKYFMPTIFTVFLLTGAGLQFAKNSLLNSIYIAGVIAYAFALAVALYQISMRERNIGVTAISVLYIVLTHIWYGVSFARGLVFTRELRSALDAAANTAAGRS